MLCDDALIADTQVGREFGVVSPMTSLIVLDTLEQYLKYDIEPPTALAKMREQWNAIRAERGRKKREREELKIVQVLQMWKRSVFSLSSDRLLLRHKSIRSFHLNRMLAWWNEDVTSPEFDERFTIHAAEFGKGIDAPSKFLADQWAAFQSVLLPPFVNCLPF